MTAFPEPPKDDYAILYLENTDQPLPARPDPNLRYAYFKTIATGGKAIIQSCKDMFLSRTICYKKLKPEFADNPDEQSRFLREARVSAMLQHPNTVPTYELGRDTKGHYYFTMKLVHGYTLREVLDYRERYDLNQLINVVTQVAQALMYAHSHRVLHRDIKPENILVGPFGEVLLLDWGLAKVWKQNADVETETAETLTVKNQKVSSITDHEKVQGTISYMSPEQVLRDPNIDYRSDIFSLGVILYEILAAQLPTEKETVDGIIEEIKNVRPRKPSEISKQQVPKLLEEATMRCLEKSVEERMPSCAELINMLEEDW